ncbi:CD276 antigen-like [Neoarius graeffei]|uniref:CD276 antigen-like n=1 Tax=Neoarius graeffei TaxID=443677 RepID=UPI00298D3A98|nr:CD276 antigen-like [Neoarius graeffei]
MKKLTQVQSSRFILNMTVFNISTSMFVSVAEFEISVPTRVQTAVYTESVVLSCTFPVSGSWDAGSSVITWQRKLEVVHSFFNGQDQPQFQSQRYANRTSLFHQELKKGNASLRLDRTIVEDAGEYTCSSGTINSSITFIMKNPDLGQEIRRNIDLFSETGGDDEDKQKITAYFLLGLATGMIVILCHFFGVENVW